jgi:hypothetical protein
MQAAEFDALLSKFRAVRASTYCVAPQMIPSAAVAAAAVVAAAAASAAGHDTAAVADDTDDSVSTSPLAGTAADAWTAAEQLLHGACGGAGAAAEVLRVLRLQHKHALRSFNVEELEVLAAQC